MIWSAGRTAGEEQSILEIASLEGFADQRPNILFISIEDE